MPSKACSVFMCLTADTCTGFVASRHPEFQGNVIQVQIQTRSGSKHRHGFAGRNGFKCLPKSKASSILKNRQHFCGKLTGKCHPCSFPAAKSPLLVLSLDPHSYPRNDLVGSRGGHSCGWDGGWISVSRHSSSVLKLILYTRYFEDAGDRELCWLLNPLIFQSLWPLTPLTPLCHLTPSSS